MNSFILNEAMSFNAFRSIDFKDLIKSSYISVIKAIVPPDTPGMMLAMPIAIPLMNSIK